MESNAKVLMYEACGVYLNDSMIITIQNIGLPWNLIVLENAIKRDKFED